MHFVSYVYKKEIWYICIYFFYRIIIIDVNDFIEPNFKL